MGQLPARQRAVQLVGPDELVLNDNKEVPRPGEYQIVCKVEAVGLCFSDLKLLKQFSEHPRKAQIVSGIDLEVLKQIPSYVPESMPTVPGHESVVRVVERGPGVKSFKPGERYLVETDYRWLPNENSNGSFGYNFEGALQEYVLMDERVITSPKGESMLLPVSENLSASATALVEPWACVENAYSTKERRAIKTDGKALVVAEAEIDKVLLRQFFDKYGQPADISCTGSCSDGIEGRQISDIADLPDTAFDDVLYFGSNRQTVEILFDKLAAEGLLNIVQCGGKFDESISATVGKLHYGRIRIIGTEGPDPAESMSRVPENGEIRTGDKINVVGAAGPMGMMHVIRNICQGIDGISIFAGDVDDRRLRILERIAGPIAKKNKVELSFYNPEYNKPRVEFDYTVIMAPLPALAAEAIKDSAEEAVVNVFAGIPASIESEIDLDSYIAKRLYANGTSGSRLDDMKTVLAKVESGRLDTNSSLAAVCGLESAIEGIGAVENRSIPGKIMVYPSCKGLPLVILEQMPQKYPNIAKYLSEGLWTKRAEQALLREFVE